MSIRDTVAIVGAALQHPVSSFGMIAHRHMAEYGTTSEQLAEIAVSARQWALKNPKATHPKPLTVDDVLSSRMVSSPLHKFDCCGPRLHNAGEAAKTKCLP